jgi:putative transposase
MQLVEQHRIPHDDPRFAVLDVAAFASKNLWNAANYLVRQSFISGEGYLDTSAIYHLLKTSEAYQSLPAKVSNQVLIQLHTAWKAFFAAMKAWREHPELFTGRPKLPKYKHKTNGRNLLVYEKGAISLKALKRDLLGLSGLGEIVPSKHCRDTLVQARVVPGGGQRTTHYVIEVIYEREAEPVAVDPALFAALDLGVNNLAAITSNKPGFVPRLVNGRVLKAINQWYNKQREQRQKQLAEQSKHTTRQQFTSRRLDALTDKRNRRVKHQLHLASRAVIDLLVVEGLGTLIIGKNALWKQEVEMGRRNNQSFVQLPHTRFIAMLRYKAELVGITVVMTEESYTSKASFLDRDPLPVYDPTDQTHHTFSGRREGRWYRVKGRPPIHADVNGSYNIARKVIPTAFDGLGIAASAVRPRRLAV